MYPLHSAGQAAVAHPQQPPAVHQVVSPSKAGQRSAGLAAALELVPGIFLQTFGIGHMYAGQVALGLAIMFGYWFVFCVNIVLGFALIGLVTLPLCWLIMLIVSPMAAADSVSRQRQPASGSCGRSSSTSTGSSRTRSEAA